MNIIKVTIEQDDIRHSLPIGEFMRLMAHEMANAVMTARVDTQQLTVKSGLFSRGGQVVETHAGGQVSHEELERQIIGAGTRVIQNIRDSR